MGHFLALFGNDIAYVPQEEDDQAMDSLRTAARLFLGSVIPVLFCY
jgi:hypothetical protein